jgi:Domain of unknown function (DUF6468)
MSLISDILLSTGAFAAAIYCYVLSGRLKKFQTLEGGLGGAIAVLSAQVDDMTKALDRARGAANGSASTLETLTVRAESVAARLELMVASMHDLPVGAEAEMVSEPAETEEEGEKRLRFVRRRMPRTDLEAAE